LGFQRDQSWSWQEARQQEVGRKRRKMRAHISKCRSEAENELRVERDIKLQTLPSSDILPATNPSPPPATLNSTNKWGPSVQTLEHVRGIVF